MSGGTERHPRFAYVPALDGLRGIAVAAVLCFHGEIGFAGGGFLGVSTFFTLSGFLITSLLLLEWEYTDRIALGRFWARRARRLLPAALVTLAGVAAYGAFVASGHQLDRLGGDGLSALFDVANWRFVIGDRSYAALFSAPSPVQHFWSLAIEEQFYLVFPIAAAVLLPRLGTRGRFRVVLILLAGMSAALAFVLWSPGHDPTRIYYGTDTRAAELLVGAILATLLAGRSRAGLGTLRMRSAAGLVALGVLLLLWATTHQTDTWLYRGGLPLHAVLTAVVIAGALEPGPLARTMSWLPFRALGLISYGVYLYHWPIFLWLTPARVGVAGAGLFGLRVLTTVAIATASYRWLEMPIRRGRIVTGNQRRVLIPLGIAAVGLGLVAVPATVARPRVVLHAVHQPGRRVTPPRAPRAGRGVPTIAVRPGAPRTPAGRRVTRVMVVGDSVALTLGRGIERWGPPRGITVLNAARLYCPIARGGKLGATFGHSTGSCDNWPTYWTNLEKGFQPDVVVVLTTVWDLSERQRDEWGPDYVGIKDARFDAFIASEWRAATEVLGSTGARVVWLAPGCARDQDANFRYAYSKDHYLPSLMAAGAVTIDLNKLLCPNGEIVDPLSGVKNIRPDGLHFSDPGADLVARWLGPQITDPTPGPPSMARGPHAPGSAKTGRR